MVEPCRICHTRRPKRYCSGIAGDICSRCCGDQREVNISCPLDCQYLQEAHRHERPSELNYDDLPNKDIRVNEDFLDDHKDLAFFCLSAVVDAGLRTPGAVDFDILSAVDALIRTYRTADSGLIYETRPEDKIAAAVQDQITRSLTDFQKERAPFRNADVMRCLVFVQRYALMQHNGRPRGRAFIDFVQRANMPKLQGMSAAAGA